MLFCLRTLNTVLLVSLVACLAGAMTGLIVFAPFVAGAWFLSTTAILGLQREAETEIQPARRTAELALRADIERVESTAVRPSAPAIT